MDNNAFDKNQFKKSQNKITFFFVIILMLGIISLLCAFCLNDFATGSLPTDYEDNTKSFDDLESMDASEHYGTYYGELDRKIYTIEIDEYQFSITTTNGFIGEESYDSYEYKYILCSDAQNITANYDYDGSNAIVAQEASGKYIVIWITANGPVLNDNGLLLSNNEITMSSVTNDPKNYYDTFTYDNNYVTFYSDGTASFYVNYELETYRYFYVDEEWTRNNTSIVTPFNGIVIYKEESPYFNYFIYDGYYTMTYGSYDFTR